MRKVVKKIVIQEVSINNIDSSRFVYVCIDSENTPFRLRTNDGLWNFYSEDVNYLGVKFAPGEPTAEEAVKFMMDYGKIYEFENFREYFSWYLKENK